MRVTSSLLFKRARVASTAWMTWGRALLFVDGLVWGLAGVALMPSADVTSMAVLVATLCGVCAIASLPSQNN